MPLPGSSVTDVWHTARLIISKASIFKMKTKRAMRYAFVASKMHSFRYKLLTTKRKEICFQS